MTQLVNATLPFARNGDWCSVAQGVNTNVAFTRTDISTHAFLKAVDTVAEFAALLGNEADATKYGVLAATTRAAFTEQFLHQNATTGLPYVSDNYPISQVLALDVGGVVPSTSVAGVQQNLANLIYSGDESGFPNTTTGGTKFAWSPSPCSTFTGVCYASFGTPTGACPSLAYSACNSNRSVALVAAACVGKSSCSVLADDAAFGDPCPNVVKRLAVALTGPCDSVTYTLSATVPAGATGTAYVPVSDPSTAVVMESGSRVWAAGSFVPGTAGVLGAAVGTGVNAGTIGFSLGSGEFAFSVAGPATR